MGGGKESAQRTFCSGICQGKTKRLAQGHKSQGWDTAVLPHPPGPAQKEPKLRTWISCVTWVSYYSSLSL